MLKDYPQSLTNVDILGQGNLNLVSEKSGKSQGILLSIICGNPEYVCFRLQARMLPYNVIVLPEFATSTCVFCEVITCQNELLGGFGLIVSYALQV